MHASMEARKCRGTIDVRHKKYFIINEK